MVASLEVKDPGKHFPIFRKTIQFIESLKRQVVTKEKWIFDRKIITELKVKNTIWKGGEIEYSYTRN